jgi:hypothetical protein
MLSQTGLMTPVKLNLLLCMGYHDLQDSDIEKPLVRSINWLYTLLNIKNCVLLRQIKL